MKWYYWIGISVALLAIIGYWLTVIGNRISKNFNKNTLPKNNSQTNVDITIDENYDLLNLMEKDEQDLVELHPFFAVKEKTKKENHALIKQDSFSKEKKNKEKPQLGSTSKKPSGTHTEKHSEQGSGALSGNLQAFAKAIIKREAWRAPSGNLQKLAEALIKREAWRAPGGDLQKLAEALIKKEAWRAPNGDLRNFAEALVRREAWRAPNGKLRKLAEALITRDAWRASR